MVLNTYLAPLSIMIFKEMFTFDLVVSIVLDLVWNLQSGV